MNYQQDIQQEYSIQLMPYGVMVFLPSGSHQKVYLLNSSG